MTDSEHEVITTADVAVVVVAEAPKVGDYVLHRGVSWSIEKLEPHDDCVRYKRPSDNEPAEGEERGTVRGAGTLSELRPMKTPLGTIWYFAKTLEPREVREGAIQLEPAVADLKVLDIQEALKAGGGGG